MYFQELAIIAMNEHEEMDVWSGLTQSEPIGLRKGMDSERNLFLYP